MFFAVFVPSIAYATSVMHFTYSIADPVLQISFSIPEGFRDVPPAGPHQGRHTYSNHNPLKPEQTIWFSIDGVGGRLPQESNYQLRGTLESENGFPASTSRLI